MHCVIKHLNNEKNEAGAHSVPFTAIHAGVMANAKAAKLAKPEGSRIGVPALGPKRCAAAFVFAFT